jgi:hypothetical protein
MDAGRLSCALATVLVLVAGAGCASQQPGAAAASGREELCAALLQDLRLYCKQDAVRGEHAATSMDCLSRRLDFEKACF